MAEWLGTALQKLLQRFESASDLERCPMGGVFLWVGRCPYVKKAVAQWCKHPDLCLFNELLHSHPQNG